MQMFYAKELCGEKAGKATFRSAVEDLASRRRAAAVGVAESWTRPLHVAEGTGFADFAGMSAQRTDARKI